MTEVIGTDTPAFDSLTGEILEGSEAGQPTRAELLASIATHPNAGRLADVIGGGVAA